MPTRPPTILLGCALALGACTADPAKDDTGAPDPAGADAGTDPGGGDTGVDCVVGLLEGDCAPDFTLPDADGDDRALRDFAGQRVVLIGTAEW